MRSCEMEWCFEIQGLGTPTGMEFSGDGFREDLRMVWQLCADNMAEDSAADLCDFVCANAGDWMQIYIQ